jgi:hypothetical protein
MIARWDEHERLTNLEQQLRQCVKHRLADLAEIDERAEREKSEAIQLAKLSLNEEQIWKEFQRYQKYFTDKGRI